MADREITPFGCRHCGISAGEHGLRYFAAAGVHAWVLPTNHQILRRMQMRRALRTTRLLEDQ
ncbi:hypothetical protein J7F03_20570 [Streptomyces sp. ISL-43]|uniref:hypothetical protein n=1 Tax=Streptomyces sp. ISL-43 TaxID=2819183 RepID=UPI001BE9DB46|nr:hypothetical protein [Streptomyces sp. ISL-43]MBT2449438.1 hypothetical protein [Streptomyces sp. ISL-43]